MKTVVNTTIEPTIRHLFCGAAVGCLCLLKALTVNAGITKCTLADGSVVFQDTACSVAPSVNDNITTNADAIPLGIDPTWFDQPPIVPYQPVCTTSGCDCGGYSREFQHGLSVAVADALYLDGSWHRLDVTLNQLALITTENEEYEQLQQESIEAACNILMSQKTLRKFGNRALSVLRKQKRHAEDMGLDSTDDCKIDNPSTCEHADNIALYDRIISDIKALSISSRISADD